MPLRHNNALTTTRILTILKTTRSRFFLLPLSPTIKTLTLILITPNLNPSTTSLADLIIHTRTNERLYTGAMVLIRSFQET